MKTFKVTYPNGKTDEINSDDATVEALCNSHFGSSWEVAQEHGASVEMEEFTPPEPGTDMTLESAFGINKPLTEAEQKERELLEQEARDLAESERLEVERVEVENTQSGSQVDPQNTSGTATAPAPTTGVETPQDAAQK